MKTLTEITAQTLKNAITTQESLVAAGKTPEELPAALGEALKLEGDKLNYLHQALQATGGKVGKDFKRVVIMSLAEGEKPPQGAQQVGEIWCKVENFVAPQAASRAPGNDRDGGRGGRGGKGGKGGPGGRDGKGRGPGGPGGPGGGGRGDGRGRGPGGPGGPGGRTDGPRTGAPRNDKPPVITPKAKPTPSEPTPGASS